MMLFTQKPIIKLLLFLCIASFSVSCLVPKKEKTALTDSLEVSLDSVLANKLGADAYGMKTYVMAFLKKGPNRSKIDSITASELQKAHMQNIGRLVEAGKLVVAGPFEDNTDLRGIYIFDVPTVAEAQKLCETDPAIKAGSLAMELHPWYSSAALVQVKEIHKKIVRKPI